MTQEAANLILMREMNVGTLDNRSATQGRRPFFSVIMPAYGVKDYIAHAIECVQNQTFQDWELIVVDDCSVDGSGDIAQAYVEGDSRIRVVKHSQNRGLSVARNTGLDEARGLYVWMPDSDDAFDADLLERAHDAASEVLPDVVMFGYVEDYYDAEGAFLYENKIPMNSGSYVNPNDWRPLIIGFERDTHYGYAWNKIYKKCCVSAQDLRFEKVRLIEDIVFNAAFFQDIQSVVVLPGTPYRYAKRQGRSLTNANAFSAREYYELHHRRVEMIRNQLAEWDIFDQRAKAILGGLYARYALSAIERSFFPGEPFSGGQRRAWLKGLFKDDLFRELIPCAQSQGSRALALCLIPFKIKSPLLCAAMGRVIYFMHENFYQLFTRLRSGR